MRGFPWEPEDIVVERDADGRYWLAAFPDDVIVTQRGKIRHQDGKAVTQEKLRYALLRRCVQMREKLPHDRAIARLLQCIEDWQGMYSIAAKRADNYAAEYKLLKEAARGDKE